MLVALTWRTHLLHHTAQGWFKKLEGRWATTVVTEMGLLRLSMNPAVTGASITWPYALEMLRTIRKTPGHELWTNEFDIMTSPVVARAAVGGHRQVTDLYLAALAKHHGGLLATLDAGVCHALHPEDRHLVKLVPT